MYTNPKMYFLKAWKSLPMIDLKIKSKKNKKERQFYKHVRFEDVQMKLTYCRVATKTYTYLAATTARIEPFGFWINVPVLWPVSCWNTVRTVKNVRIYLMTICRRGIFNSPERRQGHCNTRTNTRMFYLACKMQKSLEKKARFLVFW